MNDRMRAMRDASSPLMGQFFSPVKKETLQVLQNEILSLTEERDFFKSKYSSQMDDIARLEKELKSARNQVTKLREELIAVELDRAKEAASNGETTSIRSETCPSTEGILSSGNVSIAREGDFQADPVDTVREDCDDKERAPTEKKDEDTEGRGKKDHDDDGRSEDEDVDKEENDDEDEDDAIREHAAKMLIWANYQEVRANSSTRRQSADALSAASPASSLRSPEPVPRTIHASGLGDADASVGSLGSRGLSRGVSAATAVEVARASARSLLGLSADNDYGDGEEEEDAVSYYEGESDVEDASEVTPAKPSLDGVRKMLSPQF